MQTQLMYKPGLPDSLTFLRLVSTIPCALLIVNQYWLSAGLLFIFAVITDMADGYIARRQNKVTRFGGLMDHGSDAVFVTACLSALAYLGLVPWLLPLLAFGSFIQYVMDSKALAGKPLRTSFLGRYNGILYYVLSGFPTLQYAFKLFPVPDSYFSVAGWMLITSTIVSMLDRLITLLAQAERKTRG